MPPFPSEPCSKHINKPLLHFTYLHHSRPDSCHISSAYRVVSGPISYLPLACFQSIPRRAGEKTFKMIIQITRLPCLKPFCGFPSRTEDQIPDHGLQDPAPDHLYSVSPDLSGLDIGPLYTELCPPPLRVSAFAVPLAQDALPTTRILLRCHLCRSHLVRDTPLEFNQGSLVSFAGDPTVV